MNKSEEENAYSHELESLVLEQIHQTRADSKSQQQLGQKRKLKRYLGIMLALLSALFLSFANILTRLACLFSGSEIALIGYTITLLVMSTHLCARRQNLLGPREHRRALFIRSLAVIVGVVSMANSVKLISPSDATAVFQTNVIVVALLASFVFNEVLSFIHIFCLFIAISGK